MKGNTKLIGFGIQPRKDGSGLSDEIIWLGRWGKKVSIVLAREAVDAIRKVCTNELPIRPPEALKAINYAEYDMSTRAVRVVLNPLAAKQIAELLRAGSAEVKEENAQLAEKMADELEAAYQEDSDYLKVDGEPGVPQ